MSGKTIAIVEPDGTVASILSKSILGYDPTSSVHAYSSPEGTKELSGADVLICDLACLVQALTAAKNPIPVAIFDHAKLVISNYGSNLEGVPSNITEKALVLPKPIEQRGLSTLLTELIGPIDTEIAQQSSLSLEQHQFCHKKITELRSSVSARCVLLCDSVGSVIDIVGNTGNISFELITSLLGGGLGTLYEAGNVIDHAKGYNLAYREGEKTDLYAVSIGQTLFLAILIDRISNYARLGTVWYYSKQFVQQIAAFLRTSQKSNNQNPIFKQSDSVLISEELDKLSF